MPMVHAARDIESKFVELIEQSDAKTSDGRTVARAYTRQIASGGVRSASDYSMVSVSFPRLCEIKIKGASHMSFLALVTMFLKLVFVVSEGLFLGWVTRTWKKSAGDMRPGCDSSTYTKTTTASSVLLT